jgi:hypothetical protein
MVLIGKVVWAPRHRQRIASHCFCVGEQLWEKRTTLGTTTNRNLLAHVRLASLGKVQALPDPLKPLGAVPPVPLKVLVPKPVMFTACIAVAKLSHLHPNRYCNR